MNEEGLINCHLEGTVKDANISKGIYLLFRDFAENSLSGLHFSRWWAMWPEGHSFKDSGADSSSVLVVEGAPASGYTLRDLEECLIGMKQESCPREQDLFARLWQAKIQWQITIQI